MFCRAGAEKNRATVGNRKPLRNQKKTKRQIQKNPKKNLTRIKAGKNPKTKKAKRTKRSPKRKANQRKSQMMNPKKSPTHKRKGEELGEKLNEKLESIDWDENYEKAEEAGKKAAEWLNKLFE